MKEYCILYYSSVRNEWIATAFTSNRDDAIRDYNVAKGLYLHVKLVRCVLELEHDEEKNDVTI